MSRLRSVGLGILILSNVIVPAAKADVIWRDWQILPGSKDQASVRQGSEPNSVPPNESYFQLRNDSDSKLEVSVFIVCPAAGRWGWSELLAPHSVSKPNPEYCFTPFEIRLMGLRPVGD
jgi:hypothetical protein